MAKTSNAVPMVSFVMTVRTTSKTRSFGSLLITADHLAKLRVKFNRFTFTTARTDSRFGNVKKSDASRVAIVVADRMFCWSVSEER